MGVTIPYIPFKINKTQMEEPKKKGNPNFGKPKEATADAPKWDSKKRYQFKLIQTHEKAKPRDKETGEMLDNPYPPIYLWINSGAAINPATDELENWRYVFGYNTIWVKDQNKPTPSKQQLENPKNDVTFKNGSLFVNGNNTSLLEALTVQDEFEGNENPYNNVPKVFMLVNQDVERRKIRESADLSYLAEKNARECSFEAMLPVAMAFGINVDEPEENEDRIRDEFIIKAKTMPEAFSRQFIDPKNKYRYVITQALRDNVISSDFYKGSITLVDTGKAFFEINPEKDAAEQFASMIERGDPDATKLWERISALATA